MWGGANWDQGAFDKALNEKYRQSAMTAAAQAAEANARAGALNQQALMTVPLAKSSMAVDSANIDNTNMNTKEQPRINDAIIALQNAQRDAILKGLPYIGLRQEAEIRNLNSNSANNDANSVNTLDGIRPAGSVNSFKQNDAAAKSVLARITAMADPANGTVFTPTGATVARGAGMSANAGPLLSQQNPALLQPTTLLTAPSPRRAQRRAGGPLFDTSGSFLTGHGFSPPLVRPFPMMYGTPKSWQSDQMRTGTGMYAPEPKRPALGMYKRGVTSVPGKGSGDKMPALLEPKEAVLNKHAADKLGRGKIAKLNREGNQKRAKMETQRTSKLAQALKQIGMI